MTDLSALAEMEHEDSEYVPEILPVDARLSIKGSTAQLLPLFARAASVSPTKEVVPGTAFALLEAVGTSSTEVAHLRITATDGEQTVSVVVGDITVLMPGAVLVPAKRLHDILKLAPTQTAKIEVIGTAAVVRSGRAQWTVQTPVGDSLHTLLDVGSIQMQTIETEPFVNALSIARLAASASSAWLGLNQIMIRNGSITGCDGGRLHRAFVKGFPGSVDTTIPVRAADELLKALRASDSPTFEMGYDERVMMFRIEQDSIVAQRLLTPFPDVENLLLGPVFSNTYSLSFDRAEMMQAIRRIRINADPDTAGIALLLVPAKTPVQGELKWSLGVRAKDRNGNASQEILECQWTGPAKSKAFIVNHRYLLEFLEAYETETVFLKMGDSTRAAPAPLLIEDTVVGFSGIVQQMFGTF